MSDFSKIAGAAFFDELDKIASKMNVPKSRIGRRSISVDKLLKKEKDGTLYKEAFVVGYEDTTTGNSRPKKKGESPTRDDTAPSSREDGRENATNVSGPSTLLNDIGTRGDL